MRGFSGVVSFLNNSVDVVTPLQSIYSVTFVHVALLDATLLSIVKHLSTFYCNISNIVYCSINVD